MKAYLEHRFSTDDFDLVSVIDELPLWSAPFGMDLLNTVKLQPDACALDIGCGLGFPMIELAQRLGPTGKVYGIDPWKRAIERIRLKIKILGIKNAEVIEGIAEKLPFKGNYFDVVVSNNGLNNVDDLKLSLSECRRVCKTGAQFVFTFNLDDTMMEFYSVFEEILKENNLNSEIQKMRAHIYLKRRPLNEFKILLNESGFRINSIRHGSFKMDFLDGTAMLNHYLIKYWFLPGWKEILKEEDREMIFDLIENKLNGISCQNGRFSLSIPYVTADCVSK